MRNFKLVISLFLFVGLLSPAFGSENPTTGCSENQTEVANLPSKKQVRKKLFDTFRLVKKTAKEKKALNPDWIIVGMIGVFLGVLLALAIGSDGENLLSVIIGALITITIIVLLVVLLAALVA